MSESQRPIASGDAIVHGRDLAAGFDETCDVVVVGSGAGGSVVATLLAEAGLSVVVLEEGPYYRADQYRTFTPSQSVRKLFREAGMMTAFGVGQTPIISITVGRAVGGSSVLTGGVCFRIPSSVHRTWVRDLGLDELSERALEPAYEDVERRMHVTVVPESARSRSTQRFVEGAARLGIPMKPLKRNTGDECEGNARCNFACPKGAKRSVDVSYLPRAVELGARIVSDAIVEKILTEDGLAAGVEGRLLGGAEGAAGNTFRVRAPVVVVACGTLHTPLLLTRSGLGRANDVLGRHITLHPAVRVVARFDERLDGWNGALQSVHSEHFDPEGIKLVGVYSAPNVLAAGFPGVGPAFRRRVEALPYCGVSAR
jgi:choline dehydrogenase-like flavoprotein